MEILNSKPSSRTNKAMFIHKLSSGTRSRLQNSQEIHSIAKAVEELVYNAIDSEATSIAVRVHLQSNSFQVIDNGVGIQSVDIPYVGKKHYTSKIFTVSDLCQPPTKYGYKGVTLAKLVSVSETLTITSRYVSEQETWMKSYHKGKEDVKVADERVSKGTTVHVQGFLFNLNIQRQSIDRPKEMQNIKNFLERTSILHCNISFSLRDDSDKSVLLSLHKSKDIYQAIQAAFGLDIRGKMYELEVKKNSYTLKAFVSKMVDDVNLQLVFLNGRLSVDSKLDSIVKSGFNKLVGNDIGITTSKAQNKKTSIIYPKAQGKLLYLIFLTCPYEVYQFDNRTERTIIEFDQWEPISKIIDKLIMFYRETLTDNDKLKDEIVTYNDNDANIKDRVEKIVSRVLRSHKNKFGLSQVHNGIRGKVAKRKKIRSSKHSKRKKASAPIPNMTSIRKQPQALKINNHNERTPGHFLQILENKRENWLSDQIFLTSNNNEQNTQCHLQAVMKAVDSNKRGIKEAHYNFEQKNKMLTKQANTQTNSKHEQVLSKKTKVTKTLTREIIPNMGIGVTQEHQHFKILGTPERETDQNQFKHKDEKIKNFINKYYFQDHFAVKSVKRKKENRISRADNHIQENKIFSYVSTVKTYDSHCCATHQKKPVIKGDKSKHRNKKKYQFHNKNESPCIKNRIILPNFKFPPRGLEKNISHKAKFRTKVDLQKKCLIFYKKKSESRGDRHPTKYSYINSRQINMVTSTKSEINFDNELMQKEIEKQYNGKHPNSILLCDYALTGNDRKQGVIHESGEFNNLLSQKYMSIKSTIRSKTSSLKVVSTGTNIDENYCSERKDFGRILTPIYSNNDLLAYKNSNHAKDFNIYFNRGINTYSEYSESPYFRNPNCNKNIIDNNRLTKNFKLACNAINWADQENFQRKSPAQIRSNHVECWINQEGKLTRDDKYTQHKCMCNKLENDTFYSFAPRAKREFEISATFTDKFECNKKPINIEQKLASQSNVVKNKILNEDEPSRNYLKGHIVTEKRTLSNLNTTYAIEEDNDLNQDYISKDAYQGNDNQLLFRNYALNPNTFVQFERFTQTIRNEPNRPTTSKRNRYPQKEEIIFISQECNRSSRQCCFDPVTLCVPQLESSDLFEESLHFETNSLNKNRNHHNNIATNDEDFDEFNSSRYIGWSENVNDKSQNSKSLHQSVRIVDSKYRHNNLELQSDDVSDGKESDSRNLYPESHIISNKENTLVHRKHQNNKRSCHSSNSNVSHTCNHQITNNQVANTTYTISEPLHTSNGFQTTDIFSGSKVNLYPSAVFNSKEFLNARITEATSKKIYSNPIGKDSVSTAFKTNDALNTMTAENKCWQEVGTGANNGSLMADKLTPTQSKNNPFIIRKRSCYVPKGYSQLMEKRVFFTPVLEPSQDYFNESVYEEFVDEVVRGEAVVRGAIGPEAVNDGPWGRGAGAHCPPAAVALDHTALALAQVVRQVDRKFIALVVRAGAGAPGGGRWLAMVDQHAAHERVRVHQLLREYKRGGEWVSREVEGWEVVVGGEEAGALRRGRQLRALGLRWHQLGPHRVRLTAVPLAIVGHQPRDREAVRSAAAALLREQARSLRQQHGAGDAHPPAIMRLLNSEACQSAIKFGQALSAGQCAALASQLARCPLPFQCAHGRPTVALVLPLSDTPHHAYTVKASQLLAFRRYMKEARM